MADESKTYPPPFSLRLTFAERAELERAAAGMPLGAYIRSRLFARIRKQNEFEAWQCFVRDRAEKDAFVFCQLDERRALQEQIKAARMAHAQEMDQLRRDVGFYMRLNEQEPINLRDHFREVAQPRPQDRGRRPGFDLEHDA